MNIKKVFLKQRLSSNNIVEYIKQQYPNASIQLNSMKIINNIPILEQSNYGTVNDCDCTLTSITCLALYYLHLNKEQANNIYTQVREIASKYFFTENRGTQATLIRTIMNKVAKQLKINKNSHSAYGKNIGFNFKGIQKFIDNGKPCILSLWEDGRDFYQNHSITIIGYQIFKVDGKDYRFLLVADNWYNTFSYLDYDALSVICSLNYF